MKKYSSSLSQLSFLCIFLIVVVVEGKICLTPEILQEFGIKPVSRHPIDDKIVLERDWWNGHYITTEIGRILLAEAMGFPIEIKDYEGSTSFLEMSAGHTDINFELWPFSQLQGDIDDLNIRNAGPTGIIGRVGLYFPRWLSEDPIYNNENQTFLFEAWRSYSLNEEILDIFPRAGDFPDVVDGREFVPPPCLIETFPQNCDVYGPSYDNFTCNITRVDSVKCMTIFSYDFSYDGAWMHQLIRNLHLNWTVSHLYEFVTILTNFTSPEEQKPFVVYSWTPNNDVNRFNLQRINFQEISPQCVSDIGETKDGKGSVNCDFQIQVILKIHHERLLSTISLQQAAQFVRSFSFTTEEQELLLYEMGSIDPNPTFGTDPENTLGLDLACEWVKNNSATWKSWVVNVPLPPLPYLTFWYNAAVIALFFTCFLWLIGSLLCICRRHSRPLVSISTYDLVLGSVCPLFAMFVPIGILRGWDQVGCYSSLWLLTMATPISFLPALFMSYRVVIEVILQDLRSAFVLKRITTIQVTKRLEIIRILKNIWCRLIFLFTILLISIIIILSFNTNITNIRDGDEICQINSSWRLTLVTELIFYFLLTSFLATPVMKASHTRAFFISIFPLAFVLMAVAVSALFQSDIITTQLNPFSFNAVFSLHWIIAMIVYLVVVFDPAIRSLSSLRLHKVLSIETDVELSLTMLLDSAVGFRHFLIFSREQFCEENVLALRAVYRYEQNPSIEEMDKIYSKSLDRSSLFAVNISAGCAARCEKAYTEIKNSSEPPTKEELQRVFADVETELRRLIDYNLVAQFKNSPHFENFVTELDDKENASHSHSNSSVGFKRLRSRLGIDAKRSQENVLNASKGNEKGSKHDTSDPSNSQSTVRSSHSKMESKDFDFLGLPTAFSANTRVSKTIHTTGTSPPSPVSPSSSSKNSKIEMASTTTENNPDLL